VVEIFNQTNLLNYSTLTTGTFFQQWVQLAAGPNTIQVVARDGEGREDSEFVTVTRIPAIVIKYDLKDPEPKIDAGIGGDPDPGRKNASGVNLGSLDIELNGNDVPISELVFRDNETGDAFDPDDLSVTHYDVTIEYAPKIQDLNSGSNTTSVFCKDNMGNEIQAAQVTNFNANF